MPSEPEIVPFEIVKESWLDLTLKDGIRLRARPSLVFLQKEPVGNNFRLGVRSALTIVTVSPSRLRGKPTKVPDVQKEKPVAEYNAEDWVANSQSECIYRAQDGSLVFLRLAPNFIHRFNAFSPDGEPYMVLNHSTDVEIVKPMPAPAAGAAGQPTLSQP